jgi:uncharacterized protein (TIGR02118 family)
MIKIVVLLRKRADLSDEEFQRYWQETHRPLLARLPGLGRLVLNRVLPDPSGGAPAYDGIGEAWFDDAEAMFGAFASPAGQAVAADVPNFIDGAAFQQLVVAEEEVTLPTEPAALAAHAIG